MYVRTMQYKLKHQHTGSITNEIHETNQTLNGNREKPKQLFYTKLKEKKLQEEGRMGATMEVWSGLMGGMASLEVKFSGEEATLLWSGCSWGSLEVEEV